MGGGPPGGLGPGECKSFFGAGGAAGGGGGPGAKCFSPSRGPMGPNMCRSIRSLGAAAAVGPIGRPGFASASDGLSPACLPARCAYRARWRGARCGEGRRRGEGCCAGSQWNSVTLEADVRCSALGRGNLARALHSLYPHHAGPDDVTDSLSTSPDSLAIRNSSLAVFFPLAFPPVFFSSSPFLLPRAALPKRNACV